MLVLSIKLVTNAQIRERVTADGFMKIGDIKGEVKPTERVGNDGRSIVHPNYNVGTVAAS